MHVLLYLLIIIITFFCLTLIGHLVHYSLHQKWMGQFHKSHMVHHLELYPSYDYFSDKYRSAGKHSTFVFFLPLALIFLGIPLTLYFLGIIPLWFSVLLFLEILIVSYAHDYIHDAFHIRGHFLNKNQYFRELSFLHYVHHVDMSKNFGIYLFLWDRLFKSYQIYTTLTKK